MTDEEVLTNARASIERLESIAPFTGIIDLDCNISIVHGNETVAKTEGSSFEEMCVRFATWVCERT